jgi:hypothetical protein
VAQAQWVLLGEEAPAAVVAFLGGKIAEGGPAASDAAKLVDSIRDGRFDPVALDALRLSAARFLVATNDLRRAVSILEDAKSPASDEVLVSLLPPAGADLVPQSAPTAVHVRIACSLAARCDAALLPRLRAIVVACPKSEVPSRMLKRFDEIVSERAPAPGDRR